MVSCEVYRNLLTDLLFTGFFKFLNQSNDGPTAASLNVSHMAVGSGVTAPTVADTQLGTETFRKAVAVKSRATRDFQAVAVLTATESNATLREIGVFANGTGTANSGTLLSRVSINKVKNSNMTLNIYWKLTLEEV